MCVSSSLNDDSPILFPNADGNSLSGSIPTELGALTLLSSLNFSKFIEWIHLFYIVSDAF